MKALIFCIIVLLAAASCRRLPVTSTIVKDSIVIKETVRVDTVRTPGDTVLVDGWVICDSVTNQPQPLKLSKRKGSSAVRVTVSARGRLNVVGECDSLRTILRDRERELSRLSSRHDTVVHTEYKTRTIDIVCRWFTTIAVLLIAAVTGLKLKGLI